MTPESFTRSWRNLPEYFYLSLLAPGRDAKEDRGRTGGTWPSQTLNLSGVSESLVTDGQLSGSLLQNSWQKIEQYGPRRSPRSSMPGEVETPDSRHKYNKYQRVPLLIPYNTSRCYYQGESKKKALSYD